MSNAVDDDEDFLYGGGDDEPTPQADAEAAEPSQQLPLLANRSQLTLPCQMDRYKTAQRTLYSPFTRLV